MQDKANWMRSIRSALGKSMGDMAKAAGCSVRLLEILEGGGVTTPLMAKDIARVYGMTAEQRRAITCKREPGKSKKEEHTDANDH